MITSERPTGKEPTQSASDDTAQNSTQHALLFSLLSQLVDCSQNASDGVPLSQPATVRVLNLLWESQQYLPTNGDLYPDGSGGLCVGWENGTRRICLVVDALEKREDYLYWQDSDEYFVETPVTTELLIKWQNWLRATE